MSKPSSEVFEEVEGATWLKADRGPYIRVYSGREVYLADPQPSDFTVGDIARHLAGINRYTGASRLTVAQHCVVAAKMAETYYQGHKQLPARILIHDADEAFVNDISRPFKSLLADYRLYEDKMQLAMEKFFDLTFIADPLVKEIDLRMWLTERAAGIGGKHCKNDYTGELTPFDLSRHWHDFEEWPADEAEAEWLSSYRRLFPWLQ